MADEILRSLQQGAYDASLRQAYPKFETEKEVVYERLSGIVRNYESRFGTDPAPRLFSAPGRTEIGGNHTDHQHGCVLAAAIDRDVVCAAAVNGSRVIRVFSEGHGQVEIDLNTLEKQADEVNTTPALIRGMAARLIELGRAVGGFNAYVSSQVLGGSGLSSSAAFEVGIGAILNGLFCESSVSPIEIAQIAQYAENVYFGKPSGLMDQMASSVGGFVAIDFQNTEKPLIRKIDFDLNQAGYALCVIDSGASHAELTDEYAAITSEMRAVAACFDQKYLREVDEQLFMKRLPEVRRACGDRAVLRAFHYFAENKRAIDEAARLEQGDVDAFLRLARESGESSYMYLQNVIVSGEKTHQEMAYVLAVCGELLGRRGAFRIQGGGFAGTIQAFVPLDMLPAFKAGIEHALTPGCCYVMSIRSAGGCEFLAG